mgnify:CR=1 FL=1
MDLQKKLISLFYEVAKSEYRVRKKFILFGFIFFWVILGLFIIIPVWIDIAFRHLEFPLVIFNNIISIPIIVLGVCLMLWAVIHFLRARGTPVPFNPPPKLIQTGLYAYSRNPMLTGIFIWMFGLGILYRSISLMFISVPLFVIFNIIELKMIEEPELTKRFGKDYLEYKKRAPMFIPRFGKRRTSLH